MKWQQIPFLILFSPIIIPALVVISCVLFILWGFEYALTGKYNQDDGGW